MKKIKKNRVIENPKNEKGCFGSIITSFFIGAFIFFIGAFILDFDKATGTFLGRESETYFVVEKYGYPYKLLKKKPGYQYRIENGEIVKIKIKGYAVDSVKKPERAIQSESQSKAKRKSKSESKTKDCYFCKGLGYKICRECNGSAIINCQSMQHYRGFDCYACKGSGITKCTACIGGKKKCYHCDGTGKDI